MSAPLHAIGCPCFPCHTQRNPRALAPATGTAPVLIPEGVGPYATGRGVVEYLDPPREAYYPPAPARTLEAAEHDLRIANAWCAGLEKKAANLQDELSVARLRIGELERENNRLAARLMEVAGES